MADTPVRFRRMAQPDGRGGRPRRELPAIFPEGPDGLRDARHRGLHGVRPDRSDGCGRGRGGGAGEIGRMPVPADGHAPNSEKPSRREGGE
ncbi:hypothetical protein GCM10010515_22130 [Streptomyces fructofermentans]|uniref:Uncharacterized protein n=1 Tax=Streptomyces fructofermentans TaxID=152141 RepID=A0A918K8E7_9ACTN|nr:hypothetical protein GCM10010515_22130 [Streptomyces fructofermentans]